MIPQLKACCDWYSGAGTPSDKICATRDIFHARLNNLMTELLRAGTDLDEAALLTAVVGEIGNNSFDHNLGQWQFEMGSWFDFEITNKNVVVWLADRGNGFLHTLKNVLPDLKDDQEAISVAFHKRVSGRAPERRGNGLKFVRFSVNGQEKRGLYCCCGKGKFSFGGAIGKQEPLPEKLKLYGTGVFVFVWWGIQ